MNLVDCPLVVLEDPFLLRLAGDAEVPEDDGPVGGSGRDQLIVDRRPDDVVAAEVVVAALAAPEVALLHELVLADRENLHHVPASHYHLHKES